MRLARAGLVILALVLGSLAFAVCAVATPPDAHRSWSEFCGVAHKIAATKTYAYAPGRWGNPKLPGLHRALVAAAPTGKLQAAMRRADSDLQSGVVDFKGLAKTTLAAMRTVNRSLIAHCRLDTTIFGIIVGPLAPSTAASAPVDPTSDPAPSMAAPLVPAVLARGVTSGLSAVVDPSG